MVLTHIKIALRNTLKHKVESGISIIGLGIGLGSVFLLSLLVIHEFSFNQFVPGQENAFRVLRGDDCQSSYLLAPTAKDEIPEIESYFRFYQTNTVLVKDKTNQILEEQHFALADPSIFQLWGVKFKYGKPAQNTTQIALSESMAKKYLSAENFNNSAILIKLKDDFLELNISGIYRDFPSNSTIHPNFIANIELSGEVLGQASKLLGQYALDKDKYKSWEITHYYTYFFLNPLATKNDVVQKLQSYKQNVEESQRADYSLQPINESYLNSKNLKRNIFSRTGNADELQYYVALAFLILLVAIVNYVFLTRAKIMTRLTELGAKKALGASTGSIRLQVLFEATLVSFISVFPAIFIVAFGMSFVNSTLGKSLGIEVLYAWQSWLVFFVFTILTGTISGFFISFKISKISAVALLAGQSSLKTKKNLWNNSFLSFHFVIFIILIVAIFSFKKQISYSLTNFKSINPDNILICGLNTPALQKQIGILQNSLENTPGVVRTAGTSFIPPFNDFLPVRLRSEDINIRFDGLIMGEGMTELLEMEFLEGEPFGDFPSGYSNIIFNESAALKYNIKVGVPFNGFNVKAIVKDFTAHSTRRLIEPMAILQQHPDKMRYLAVKTTGENDEIIQQKIHDLIKQVSPNALVDVTSLTDQINHFYQHEQNQTKLISAFSILAIVLAIMGLFGIVLNTISKRTKEIGIRKVNGATVSEILGMLNGCFLKWIVIAFVVACPIAYYAMTKWLENFAYKTTLSWWIFVLAGVLALAIALLTVSWQSWRAATRNPVEALRYE